MADSRVKKAQQAAYKGREGLPMFDEEVITSSLNVATLADEIEFTKFEETIKDFVMGRLGHPTIRVELTPYQIKTAIDEAISKLGYHAPYWTTNFYVFKVEAGEGIVELPQYVADNLTYVVYKKTLLSIQSQGGTLEFDFFIKYFQDNFLFSDFSVGDFYLLQQHLEQLRKILGQEGTWDIVGGKYLQLQPPPPVQDTVICEYRALNSDTLHFYYKNWIQKYALAICKNILGRVRSKYKQLPSPGGGAILDGPELIQESKQDMEELEIKLLTEIEEGPTFTTF